MKYAISKCINGNFFIDSEWSDLVSTKASYHGTCKALWNEPGVITAHVAIINEQLDVVEGYKEYIHHDEPAPISE